MANLYELEGFYMIPLETEREINFIVKNKEGYVCRLVPRIYGFDISPLDKALDNLDVAGLVPRLSNFILNRDG
jgi:hypothetical protein